MASTAHGALVANQIKTVEVDAGRFGIVIVNRAQEGVIWVRLDGQDPVPEGGGTYAVFGAREFSLTRAQTQLPVSVRMLCNSAYQYSVEGF